jgi:hypothetical protein
MRAHAGFSADPSAPEGAPAEQAGKGAA